MSDARCNDPRDTTRVIPATNGHACTTRATAMTTILEMA